MSLFNVMHKHQSKKVFECAVTSPKLIPVIECACGIFFDPLSVLVRQPVINN